MSQAHVVRIVPVNPPGSAITALHGDGFWDVAPEAGWSFVGRPRRVGFTEWQGADPLTLSGPLLFDGFRTGTSVEPQIAALRSLMRSAVGTRREPAVCRVEGAAVVGTSLLWVVQSMAPGTLVERRKDGARIRQDFTVTLLEYVGVDVAVTAKATPAKKATAGATATAARPAPSSKGTAKTYTVKKGDTLSSIASRVLKTSNWHPLQDLNGIRDPKSLRVGQVLRLP